MILRMHARWLRCLASVVFVAAGTAHAVPIPLGDVASNDVMIGGFVIGGSRNKTVVVRARGPSLAPFGIANPIADPQLRLVRSSDGATIDVNDDWRLIDKFRPDPIAAVIGSIGFAPSNALESAILISLPPGGYTALVTGFGGATGVAIVEVFAVP